MRSNKLARQQLQGLAREPGGWGAGNIGRRAAERLLLAGRKALSLLAVPFLPPVLCGWVFAANPRPERPLLLAPAAPEERRWRSREAQSASVPSLQHSSLVIWYTWRGVSGPRFPWTDIHTKIPILWMGLWTHMKVR